MAASQVSSVQADRLVFTENGSYICRQTRSMSARHIHRTIESSINIAASPESIWENITNVRIEQFSDPFIFRLLGIPKPLKAELIAEGVGGSRIAYFSSGKRFVQKILTWDPLKEYRFSFNPEKGFRVGYLFELSSGVFQIQEGAYYLDTKESSTDLKLVTNYSLHKNIDWLFRWPVKLILHIFQRYLLVSIKRNSADARH